MGRPRKPLALHKLHGTYQPCRHDERAAKAAATHERTIPEWLPDNVKPVYEKLMMVLPPLDSVDETPLSQMAILKTQLQEDPDSMTSAQHGQLRQLAGTIREWVKDYQSVTDEPVLDEYEQWQLKRRQNRSNQPEPHDRGPNSIPLPHELQSISEEAEGDQEPAPSSSSEYQPVPLPKNLRTLKH